MAEISRIQLNPTEKDFLVGQFRDMLDQPKATSHYRADQAQTIRILDSIRCSRMVEIANLDNVQIDVMLTKPEWPTDFPVTKRRQILITVDEIIEEKRNW